jgi:hypothetical protein
MRAITRRHLLRISGIGVLAWVTPMHGEADERKRKLNKQEWMAQWMAVTGRTSESPLHLGRFRDPVYFLLKPITWQPNSDQVGKFEAVEVPAGFVSDLASIPPIFYTALRPDGEYAYAAIIHDFLYWTQTRPRKTADQVFRLAMADFEVSNTTISAIYQAVRRFGGRPWEENALLRSQGEKRVLKEFPPTAGIRWADWKKKSDVFGSEGERP